jgi:MFS superfamily sulfate permease-like transporter
MTPGPVQPTARRPWPILAWVPGYRRDWLQRDAIAGLTVCAILVPEGMAYAELAGMPPQTAFYAAPIALLAYAVLGSSRQLVVAVSSAIAIMSAATISELAVSGSAEYAALTAALAILAGLVSVAAGVLKLGRIAQFFSESVLIGFVFGLALLISIKQIPKLLGIEAEGETAFELIRNIVPQLRETDMLTLAVGLSGIAALVALERSSYSLGRSRRRSPWTSMGKACRWSASCPRGSAGRCSPASDLRPCRCCSPVPSGSPWWRSPRRSDQPTSSHVSMAGRSIRTGS